MAFLIYHWLKCLGLSLMKVKKKFSIITKKIILTVNMAYIISCP
jgi:hypothetical protein